MIRCFAVDVALWFAVPCAFLAAYVLVYSEPSTAVAPHLELASMPLLAVFLIRLAVARSRASHNTYFLVTSTLTSSALALLVVYYAVVLIGLHSWGGVVARVAKGTHLRVEMVRVNDEVWLPKRILLSGSARVMLVKGFTGDVDLTYSDYKRFSTESHVVTAQ